ncbi:MAG: hypothetical protein R3C03_01210 [Pirellulaceae bacterium]
MKTWMFVLLFIGIVAFWRECQAQNPQCPVVVKTEALLGEPFGIGMVSFRMPTQMGEVDPNLVIRTNAIQLTERNDRIFYPAEGHPAATRFFRGVFGAADQPADELLSIYFMFRGAEPLELTLWGCDGVNVRVEPTVVKGKKFQRILKQWWREYQISCRNQSDFGDFPDLVGTYLVEMLANRLGIDRPKPLEPTSDPMRRTMELLTDIDPLRADMIRRWFMGEAQFEPETMNLPPSMYSEPFVLDIDDGQPVEVEPTAMHVPDDCFYLRFGTWDNQLWLKRLIEEHGGDLGRMVRLRGFQAKVKSKFLNQLALESSQIDEWFGGNLIADVAVIGRDTYFNTGASVGVLLYSKDADSLNSRILQRRKRFADDPANRSKLESVEIAGEKVSFLSAEDNRYRSFYLNVGNAHLFTTSRAIAERFLTCFEDGTSLGNSNEFRFARKQLPLDREDTVFVYFPSRFFKKLLEPQYQIELYRRGKSITEMQLIQLAKLAASNEGFPEAATEFLINNGFLPQVFADRPAGSQIEIVDGEWVDRDRGRRGFFVPISDIEMKQVTRSEYLWYVDRSEFFADYVRHFEPMFAAVKRYDKGDSIERIVFDARMAPFGQEKYGWLTSMLGPPLQAEIVGSPDELVRLQLSLKGGVWQRDVPPHQLFAAIDGDVNPDIDLKPASFFDAWKTLKQVPGYLGGWPKPGTLDWLPRLGGRPDENGFTHSRLLGLWRLQFGDFSVLAFDYERLASLKNNLQVIPAERPAQMRLMIGDLAKSNLDGWANVLNYRRAWEASIANAQLMNMVVDQFGVLPGDAQSTAEQLLDVNLVCSLGGEYQLMPIAGRSIWVSDKWPDFTRPEVPGEYRAPVLGWFRGLEVELTHVNSQFSVHGFLDMERSQSTGGVLPSFDLFKGFQSLIPGGGANKDDPTKKQK